MLCLVCYLFVISTSVIDCLGRFVPEMPYYVSSGTLNLAQFNPSLLESPGIYFVKISRTWKWKVLENEFCPGKSWN